MKGLAATSETLRVANGVIRLDFELRNHSVGYGLGPRQSKSFIVAFGQPKGPIDSAPLVSTTSVVAGVGFEPTTFGL